jgi:hypothetical protein
MKYNKTGKGKGFSIIAFGFISLLLIVGSMAYVLTQSPGGVYTKVTKGDLKFKALDVYQYINSDEDIKQVNEIILEIENLDDDKDYNLKVNYESKGDNETLNVEILAGKTELVKVPNLFSDEDIDGKDIYTKVIEIKNGDDIVATFNYKLNIEKVSVDRTNTKVRIPELIIAETNSDSVTLWYDIEDNVTVTDILAVETNNSKITITNVDHELDTLVENSWAKVTLNYDVKGSVFEDEYLFDGFGVRLDVSYDETNSSVFVDIKEDLVKTNSLSDLADLQGENYEEISSVN